MNDYTPLMEEIRDIFLDQRTGIVNYREDRDEDGVHVSYEIECTRQQEDEVIELLRKFALENGQQLLSKITEEWGKHDRL